MGFVARREHRRLVARWPGSPARERGSGPAAPTSDAGSAGPRTVGAISAACAGFLASLGLIGADALWLVPMGSRVVHGHIPGSVPFATAQTGGWRDVPAGGEVVFWAAYHALGGGRGLLALQVVAAAVAFGVLAHGLTREATPGGALAVSALALLGSVPAVLLAGASTFSLALFPVLLVLLERECRAPSRRIWLGVPLLAIWGNLHGGALSGWALLACYLVFERARKAPALAASVLLAATAALGANAQLWHSAGYYRHVLDSVPARDSLALWSPLRVDFGGVLVVAVFVVLVGLIVSRRLRPRLWELVAAAGLLAATIHVERTGDWLLFVVAFPAARGLRLGAPRPRLLLAAAAALTVFALAALVRDPIPGSSRRIARIAASSGKPLLADAVLGQLAAIDGGHVWVDDPIDAFRPADQRLYLDWLDGKPSGARAVLHARLVLVQTDTPAGRSAARDARLTLVAHAGAATLYRVRKP